MATAASAKCGSADVIEALGVKIDIATDRIADCLEAAGIVFLDATAMHTAMKHVQPVRRELRLCTVFNLLGPLTNPAHASAQVVGVYSEDLVEKLALALNELGLQRALVVHGDDGLDEITISGPSKIAEVSDGQVHTYKIAPEHFGLKRASLEEISGGDAARTPPSFEPSSRVSVPPGAMWSCSTPPPLWLPPATLTPLRRRSLLRPMPLTADMPASACNC